MRLPVSIALACVALLAVAGWLYLRALRVGAGEGDLAERLGRVQTQLFAPDGQARGVAIDLQALVAGEGRQVLADPAQALPQTQTLPLGAMARLYDYAQGCHGGPAAVTPGRTGAEAAALAKAGAWAAFLCGAAPPPGEAFFRSPPLMHPSGASYVSLAAASGRLPFAAPDWLPGHADLLHIQEYRRWPAAASTLSPAARVLGLLERPALAALVNGAAAVRGGGHLFFRVHAGDGIGYGRYQAYPLAEWQAVAKELPLALVERRATTACAVGGGAYCWVATSAQAQRWLRLYAGLAGSALVALAAALAWLALARLALRRRLQADHELVLRLLTHELRTPATSLALALETMRDEFDLLPDASQRAFLRMCDEAQRLGRVIAGSSRYLKTRGPRRDRSLPQTLPSLAAFLAAVLEPYRGRIAVPEPVDAGPFRTDPYWLRLALVNLVDNALRHGGPQVSVRLRRDGAWLVATVEDDGNLASADLDELGRRGARRGEGGLGLGLGIVRHAARELGGELRVGLQPTMFTLRVKEAK